MLRRSELTGIFRVLGVLGLSAVALGLAGCSVGSGSAEVGQSREALEVSATVIRTDAPVQLQGYTSGYLAVAAGGESNLLVFDQGGRVRGLRYDSTGSVLDIEDRIELGRPEISASYPGVAYGDGVFLAVYDDFGEEGGGVYAQVIDSEGAVLNEPVLVEPDGFYGSVVFNGTDFTVAFYDGDIGLARVGLDGAVVAGSTARVTTSGIANRPVLAMAESVGLVVFEQSLGGDDDRRVYAARFSPEGEVLDPGGILISEATTSSVNMSVAAGDAEFLAVWSAYNPSAVQGSIVTFDGEVASRELTISGEAASVGGSAAASDGSGYVVVWEEQRDSGTGVYATRLSAGGSPIDAADVELASPSRAGQSYNLDLEWGNGRYSLVYDTQDGVEGRFLDAELNELDPGKLELSPVPNSQLLPLSVWTGSHYVLAWSDERVELSPEFRSVRIDDAGTVLDPNGILVSSPGDNVGGISLAFNGTTLLYTWQAWGESPVSYRRTQSLDGTWSEPEAWLTGTTSGPVASNGDGFLALSYAGDNGNGNENEIWGHVFDAEGEAAGDPQLLVTVSRPRPGLWAAGDEYLLAYSGQEIEGTPITGSVLRLTGTGEVAGEYEPVTEGILTASAGSNGQQTLFSWKDEQTGALWGRLLDEADGWQDPFVLADQVAEGTPAICWDGETFVVVWGEERTAMWSRTVSADGGLTEPERLFSGDYGWPTLTLGDNGQMLLSYVHWLEIGRRIRSRIVGELGEGIPAQPDDPGTGGEGGASPENPGQPLDDGDAGASGSGGTPGAVPGSDTELGGAGTGSGGGAQDDATGGTGGSGTSGGQGASASLNDDPEDTGAGAAAAAANDDGSVVPGSGPDEGSSGGGPSGSTGDNPSATEAGENAGSAGLADGEEDVAPSEAASGSDNESTGGCSVSEPAAPKGLLWLSTLLVAAVVRRRRR